MKKICYLLILFAVIFSASAATSAAASTQEEGILWAQPQLVQEVLDGTRTEAIASWWGFDENDSTRFLQAALNSGAKKLIIDRQASDWIVTPLQAASNQEIVLQDGVVIQAKSDEFHGTGDSLLTLKNRENVVIRAEKEGAKAVLRMHKADYQTEAYKPAEWRHGLSILSSKNVLVQDLTIEYTGGDGIYLGVCVRGVTNSDVVIRRVDCNENHRQGISVISARNLLIEDTVMRNTRGTAPQAGIDFEPNGSNEELVNCVMRRCVCENNAGDGYEFYLPNLTDESEPISIVIEDCVSRNNVRNGFNWMVGHHPHRDMAAGPMRGTLVLRNFRTENETQSGLLLRGNAADTVDFTAENVEIRNCGSYGIRLLAEPAAAESFGDVTLKNVKIVDETPDREFLRFDDGSIDGLGLARFTGNLVCERAGTVQNVVLDESWIQKNYPQKNLRRLKVLTLHPESLELVGTPEKSDADGMYVLPDMRARNSVRYLFYAQKNQEIRFVLRLCKVGRSECEPIPLRMYGPAVAEEETAEKGRSKGFSLAKLPLNESTEYCVTASETGIYVLEAGPVAHAFRLEKTSVPVVFDATRLHLISAAGNCWFYVPEGTDDFGVCVTGETNEMVRAALFNAADEKEAEADNICSTEFLYPVLKSESAPASESPKGEIRRVSFVRPSNGAFEDFTVRLQNVPPILALRPDFLLREKNEE